MGQAVGFAGGAITREREDRALADEMRGGLVLVSSAKAGASASRFDQLGCEAQLLRAAFSAMRGWWG